MKDPLDEMTDEQHDRMLSEWDESPLGRVIERDGMSRCEKHRENRPWGKYSCADCDQAKIVFEVMES